MAPTRREFLQRTGMVAVGLGASAWAGCGQNNTPARSEVSKLEDKPAPKPPEKRAGVVYGTAIGPGKYDEKLEDGTYHTRHVLSIIDLDAMTRGPARARLAKLDFFAHGVSLHPLRPHLAVLFEKHGKGCCEVDLNKAEVTRKITTAENRQFYGHGAFSADGSLLYCTEIVTTERKRGVIVVRDARTYEFKGEFPSYGLSPHDCMLIDDGRNLMISNGGGPMDDFDNPPCVTVVDIKTEELLERLEFDSALINAGHLAITSKREIAVVSAMRDGLAADATGAVSFRTGEDRLRTMTQPAEITRRMVGESLSVAIHEPGGVAGVTNPEGDIVTFWNLRERKFIKHLELTKARGIALTLDNRFFAVSYVQPGGVVMQLVDAKTLELVPGAKVEQSFLSGSHFILYAL